MNYRLATIDDFLEIIGIYRSAIDAMNANGIMQWDEIYPTADDIRKDIDTQEMYVGLKDSRICVAYTLNKESDAQYQNASWVGGINYIVVHRLCVAPEFQHQHIARNTCNISIMSVEDMTSRLCVLMLSQRIHTPSHSTRT